MRNFLAFTLPHPARLRFVLLMAMIARPLAPLFRLNFPYAAYHAFDVTPDGSRILVNTMIVSPAAPKLSASNRE